MRRKTAQPATDDQPAGLKLLLDRLDRAGRLIENAALVVLLIGMMLLAVGQIAMRELFSTGVIWADEAVKLLVLWIAMIGSIAASRDNRHIRIDALSHFLPPRAIRVVRIVVDVFAATVCIVIAWHAFRYVQLEAEFGDTVLIDTPAWLVHAVVPAAFLLVAWRFLVLVLIQVHALVTHDAAEPVP